MSNSLKVGQKVKFSPKSENWLEDYSPDGVQPGDKGIVVSSGYSEKDNDVVVDFTRKDGSLCEGFYAFPEDLEVVE